jgi:hypothetical protein
MQKGGHVQGDIQSFVVRIWPEAFDGEGNATAWRGSIDHVGSDKRLHFQDLDRLVRFIQEESGIQADALAPLGQV